MTKRYRLEYNMFMHKWEIWKDASLMATFKAAYREEAKAVELFLNAEEEEEK